MPCFPLVVIGCEGRGGGVDVSCEVGDGELGGRVEPVVGGGRPKVVRL